MFAQSLGIAAIVVRRGVAAFTTPLAGETLATLLLNLLLPLLQTTLRGLHPLTVCLQPLLAIRAFALLAIRGLRLRLLLLPRFAEAFTPFRPDALRRAHHFELLDPPRHPGRT